MKHLRWQILVVFVSLIAIGAVLLSQDLPISLEGEISEQPVMGGSYTEALIGTPRRLNPLLDFYNQVDYDVDRLIYSSLVRFDERGLPYGDLAESWGISKDGTRYSFSIRTDATWHDGQPLTSADIAFTLGLLQDEAMPLPDDIHEFWRQVKVFAPQADTLQFELPEPFAPFLDFLSVGILPQHIFGSLPASEIIASPINLKPIGSGPYRFKSLDIANDQITGLSLEAYPAFYGDRPYIQDLHFRYYSDADSAYTAYDQGEVEGFSRVPRALLSKTLQNDKLQNFTARLPRFALIYLNLDSKEVPFFRENEVRRALMLAINRTWIIDRLLDGQATPASGPVFPDSWAFYGATLPVEFDPDEAVNILKEQGYTFPAEGGAARVKEGVALQFDLVYPEGELNSAIATRIQQDWGRIGVAANLKAVPLAELLNDYLEPRAYQAALVELDFTRSPDPDPYPFWHQAQITSGQNYAQWDDRQASEFLEQARVLDDITQRTRLYRNFQVRFAAELPALPLFYTTYTYAVDRSIHGISMGPLYDPSDRWKNITRWFLQTAPQAQVIPTDTP